ncbi:MAG: hypothetical protein ABIQ62_10755 [Thermomonas sp.]
MINKHTIMLAMLLPGLAVLGGCNDRDGDDAANPAATSAEADAMTTAPMPAEPMPAETMPADPMPADNMAGHDMAAMGNEMSFADMDKNHDGGVTHDEMMDTEMLHQHFSVADADGDGKLSEAEVIKHRADMAAAPAK